ncbi:MAG TPA: LPS export ABC transporter periplasmic protein LptC [Gammaproteobacteria bacterium]|nr:LPS export ABC transporter periplasmic protein LptC [Gammaproteobacteria bacterium]
MRNQTQFILILIISTSFFYVGLIFLNLSPRPNPPKLSPSNYYKQISMSIVNLDPNQTVYLQAETAQNHHNQWDLEQLTINWNHITPWHLEAETGQMDIPSKRLKLLGHIHATQWAPPCNRTILTESLSIDLNTHQARTHDIIQINSPGESIHAVGANIKLQDNTMVFDQILNSLIDTHSPCYTHP